MTTKRQSFLNVPGLNSGNHGGDKTFNAKGNALQSQISNLAAKLPGNRFSKHNSHVRDALYIYQELIELSCIII